MGIIPDHYQSNGKSSIIMIPDVVVGLPCTGRPLLTVKAVGRMREPTDGVDLVLQGRLSDQFMTFLTLCVLCELTHQVSILNSSQKP